MKKMLMLLAGAVFALPAFAQSPEEWEALEKDVNFYLANDLGRNGYYDQKTIAETMGVMAETLSVECVLAAGDVHHFEGVRSVDDPLWMTNYELIYKHPELMIPWYAILGNHEYRSNPQAVIDYSKVSARWNMPSRYYVKMIEDNGVTVCVLMIDTAPLIDKYRRDAEDYPDAGKQDMEKELAWIDSVLDTVDADWTLVVGHHPIYAQTDKNESERADMQQRVDKILREHGNVDMYLCGHIHNFQHIRVKGSDIDYVVNSSASLARDVEPIEGTQFCSSETGFSVIAADKDELCLHMMDKNGKVLYTVKRNK